MLNVFSKGDRVDISQADRNELRDVLGPLPKSAAKEWSVMSNASSRILHSARQALAFARGEITEGFIVHVPKGVNVEDISQKTGLTQAAFARRFGFTAAAVRDWKQGRRQPEQAARVLLLLIAHNPDAVTEALAAE
jgi:putative transcriptional regulator